MMIIGGAVLVGILVIVGICYCSSCLCFKPEEEKKVDPEPAEVIPPKEKEVVKVKIVLSDDVIECCGDSFNWIVVPSHAAAIKTDTKDEHGKEKSDEQKKKDIAADKTANDGKTTKDDTTDNDNIRKVVDITDIQLKTLKDGDFKCVRYIHAEDFLGTFNHWLGEHNKDKHTEAHIKSLLDSAAAKDVGKEKPAVLYVEFDNQHIKQLLKKEETIHTWGTVKGSKDSKLYDVLEEKTKV